MHANQYISTLAAFVFGPFRDYYMEYKSTCPCSPLNWVPHTPSPASECGSPQEPSREATLACGGGPIQMTALTLWYFILSLYGLALPEWNILNDSGRKCLLVPEFIDPVFAKTSPKRNGIGPLFAKQAKTLVFNYWKWAFWACFRENWVYKFRHGTYQTFSLANGSKTAKFSLMTLLAVLHLIYFMGSKQETR